MTALEQYNLRKFCRKNEIDPAEIDSRISYYENREYLEKLVALPVKMDKLIETEEDKFQAWVHDNPLKNYAASQMYGETTSRETGKPDTTPPKFSLKTKAHLGFSLLSLVKQKPQKS